MFGFHNAFRTSIRLGTKSLIPQINNYIPKQHINWTFKQTTNTLLKNIAVPGAGLTLLNLREFLQKCKQQCDLEMNGNSSLLEILNCMSNNSIKDKSVLFYLFPYLDIVGKHMTSQTDSINIGN